MPALEASTLHSREYRFDDFHVDVLQRILSWNGSAISIPSKVFSLLLVFIRHAGENLSKERLIRTVWPDANVEPSNLTQSIFLLRRALSQGGNDYRYIVTIPGQGYLFAGRIQAAATTTSTSPDPSFSLRQARSLAVIPFQMLSAPQNLQYLGIGITDALTHRLSHINHMKVRPRSTTISLMKDNRDILSLGRELAVDLLLVGNVQVIYGKPKSASRVRVSLQLIDALSGIVVWSNIVEDGLNQLLPLQDVLAETIGTALSVQLSHEERSHLTKRPTQHAEAYQAYLKGRYYGNQWTERGWAKALDYYTQAVQCDPTFALAYSGIADAHYVVSNLYCSPNEVMPKAKVAAERSLELDPSLAEAHTSLALIQGFYEWNWEASEASFRRAISLDPGYPAAHLWYGRLLTTRGRFDEACIELRKAQRQDPLSCSINSELGRALFYARRYKEASEQLHETLEINSTFWPAQLFLGWVYEQQGLFTEALAILKQCNSLDDNARTRAFLAVTYGLAGEGDEAEKIAARLIDERRRCYIPGYYIAIVYAALGNTDSALRWLDKAYADRSEWLAWLGVEPRLELLRTDPRFQALMIKIRGVQPEVPIKQSPRLVSH